MVGERQPAKIADAKVGEEFAVASGPSGRRFWLFYTAAWIPYLYIYASTLLITGEASFWPAVLVALASAMPLAFWGVTVVWFTGQMRAPSPRWPVFLGAYLGYGVGYAVLSTTCTGLLLSFVLPLIIDFTVMEKGGAGTAVVFWQLFMALMVYATIASITYAFRSALHLRKEAHRAARAEALQAKAELQALRAQINPHFLFNTLHSTLALVRSDSAAAEEAIEQFADLLRYTTRIHAEALDRIPLGDEWKFVENYLSLERLRLGDRLKVYSAVDDDALEQLVPAFCLQPLVENAIRHGIAPRAGGGSIWIEGARLDDGVMLKVRDDGPGCKSERVTRNGRLGLRLARQRLDVLYGNDASFNVETAPGKGFTVTLWIPAQPAHGVELAVAE